MCCRTTGFECSGGRYEMRLTCIDIFSVFFFLKHNSNISVDISLVERTRWIRVYLICHSLGVSVSAHLYILAHRCDRVSNRSNCDTHSHTREFGQHKLSHISVSAVCMMWRYIPREVRSHWCVVASPFGVARWGNSKYTTHKSHTNTADETRNRVCFEVLLFYFIHCAWYSILFKYYLYFLYKVIIIISY